MSWQNSQNLFVQGWNFVLHFIDTSVVSGQVYLQSSIGLRTFSRLTTFIPEKQTGEKFLKIKN